MCPNNYDTSSQTGNLVFKLNVLMSKITSTETYTKINLKIICQHDHFC